MILDIITAALIVIPMGLGMWRGILYILVRLFGWIGALAAGFFAAPTLREFLKSTIVGDRVREILTDQIGSAADGVSQQAEWMPMILSDSVDQAARNAAEMMINTLEGIVLTILSFLLVSLAIRLLLILVIRPLTGKRGKKIRLPNKLGGLLIGSVEGLLLAFVFLAALIPLMHGTSPETAASIAESLKFSYLAGSLYDGNLLLAVF